MFSMSTEGNHIRIRVRSGDSEAEIEASLANTHEAIGLIGELLAKLPEIRQEARALPLQAPGGIPTRSPQAREDPAQSVPVLTAASSIPAVGIEKGDSLSDVISKFFSDPWGANPRKLMEVREALQSYGLNYPKQSVAVALLRLAKSSKIRRFKGEGGEYVYTASTGTMRPAAPVQPTAPPQTSEGVAAQPVVEEAGRQEDDQLNLDAPITG
jgi:hypothetical protein